MAMSCIFRELISKKFSPGCFHLDTNHILFSLTHAYVIAFLSAAPNASQRKKMIHSATTYDRHYNETAPLIEQAAGVHFPTKARTVVKGKGTKIYTPYSLSHLSSGLHNYCILAFLLMAVIHLYQRLFCICKSYGIKTVKCLLSTVWCYF